MKARLVPLYFKSARNEEFDEQLAQLRSLLAQEAEILEPVAVGCDIPDADAVIFPQLVGEAYRSIEHLQKIQIPILVVTSEFGTVAMWDWEIVTFLRSKGFNTFAPYKLELTKTICRALALKREMKNGKFLVYQDNPGDGMQASIFKRFYWWEDEWIDKIKDTFGIRIEKKSYKNLAQNAKHISDEEARNEWKNWNWPTQDLCEHSLFSAVKMYLAVKAEVEKDNEIIGVGINCLNESFHSDTTPCLAWNMLFEGKGIVWACEADTLSLLNKFIIYKALKAPVMMSNLYPFLMGMAALKHEKIKEFPDVKEPENHILIAHCGYFGLVPKCFASRWMLRPRVLEIVNDNAIAIDAEFPVGDVTLVEMHPTLTKILVTKGQLERYVQYPGSDCRNGGLIKVEDGYKIMNSLYSHHGCIVVGHKDVEMNLVAQVLGLDMEQL
ncbi:MAG: hypothetical protein ACOYEJ_04390 [Mahellales bacterium]|jgi:hypothetical protein